MILFKTAFMSSSKSPNAATTADSSDDFTPRETTTPNKAQQGVSKTVYSRVLKLHGLLNDWSKMRDKGSRLCRAIHALKLHECDEDYFPSELRPIIDNLLEILDSLKNVVEGVKVVNNQLQALAKLQPTDEPVISTWSVSKISQVVMMTCESLQKEFRVKQIIAENIGHCRDKNVIEVYVGTWEFDSYLGHENEYLFAEVGLNPISLRKEG